MVVGSWGTLDGGDRVARSAPRTDGGRRGVGIFEVRRRTEPTQGGESSGGRFPIGERKNVGDVSAWVAEVGGLLKGNEPISEDHVGGNSSSPCQYQGIHRVGMEVDWGSWSQCWWSFGQRRIGVEDHVDGFIGCQCIAEVGVW
ncbi:hypothetical protein Salat_2677900 [Sesamum alatum]|uniref:Uncharacterized protein n=1 Tax=Sesamum alatum TaxID=300844 RepID=A0AAE1XPJ6_9LAMI|nr:hypothetical protein Salat_2677900 [Sesamum alatum]